MAKPPGLIERRGQGWRVRIRVGGEQRYTYGPRSVPLLRHGTREEVEAWLWDEYRRLAKRAKRCRPGHRSPAPGIDRPPARTSRAPEKNDGPDGRSSGLFAGGPASRGSRVNITTPGSG